MLLVLDPMPVDLKRRSRGFGQTEPWTRRARTVSVFLAVAFVSVTFAKESSFPSKPIKLVVGFSPGGGTDLVARTVATVAKRYIDQPIAVVNTPGGSGTLAARQVAMSKPDGYTLLVAGGSETVSAGHFRALSYHPIKAFRVVGRVVRERIVINTRGTSPWDSLEALLEHARQNPDAVTYASSGPGSIFHVTMLALCNEAGVKMRHMPYSGSGPALAAMLGEHVDIALSAPSEAAPMQQSGLARSLAIASKTRSELLASVPTLHELGFELVIENQKGLVAPAETPPEILAVLRELLESVTSDPYFIELCAKQKMEVAYLGPDAFRESLLGMYNRIGDVLDDESKSEAALLMDKDNSLGGPFLPRAAAVSSLLLLTFALARSRLRSKRESAPASPFRDLWRRSGFIVRFVMLVAIYLALVQLVGLVIASGIFLATCLWSYGLRSWRWWAMTPALVALTLYVVFAKCMEVSLPGGIFD